MSIVAKNRKQGVVRKDIFRLDQTIINRLRKCYTALVSDLLGKSSVMSHRIKPIKDGLKVCGSAITVKGSDLTLRRMAINLARPGDVIVINPDINSTCSLYGDGTALKMKLKGIEGIVIDGFVRDSAGIKDLKYPVFATGTSAKNFHYPTDTNFGSINQTIVCGGQIVNPGDIIFGDDDGVIVIPLEQSEEIINRSESIFSKEILLRSKLNSFEKFEDVEEALIKRGYTFE